MSSIVSNTSVFTNRSFPFEKIELSQLEKRNRKYYIDFSVENTPIFLQINKVKLLSEPIFIDDEQGYIDIEIQDRISELSKFFEELDNYNQLICYKHSEEWLGKTLELVDIEKVYKSSYKDKVLRLKIEKETIKMYDMKKNKLNIDSDLKIGDTLDVIMEISGLKLMKSAFTTHIILRQIRKHPEPIPKKKSIPNEYLFLDEYSNRTKVNMNDDNSLDDQTDIDMLVSKKKAPIKSKIPINELLSINSSYVSSKKDVNENKNDINSVDKSETISIPRKIKDKSQTITENSLVNSKENIHSTARPKSVDEPNGSGARVFRRDAPSMEEQNTKDYLKNIVDTMEIENEIDNSSMTQSKVSEINSRKDKILDALENGDIGLDSVISATKPKIAKKRATTTKKSNTKFTAQELHKDI